MKTFLFSQWDHSTADYESAFNSARQNVIYFLSHMVSCELESQYYIVCRCCWSAERLGSGKKERLLMWRPTGMFGSVVL